MRDFIVSSSYFGIALSFMVYMFYHIVKEKFKIRSPFFNPLILAAGTIIILLLVTGIDFEVYNNSAGHVTFWLTPMTICLAIPLYRQMEKLKENFVAVMVSILAGSLAHIITLFLIAGLVKLDNMLLNSILSKSVTTAIALGITEELGGIQSVTIVGVTIAGLTGVSLGPSILKLVRVKEPVARGLALGTASHAVGTSKAMELGEIEGAMSSLAIVVTGILTVIIVPIFVGILE